MKRGSVFAAAAVLQLAAHGGRADQVGVCAAGDSCDGGGGKRRWSGPAVSLRDLGVDLGHVTVLDRLPTPAEVANRFWSPVGEPVLLKGAANHILVGTQVADWTDDFLASNYPDIMVEAEAERIETREAEQRRMKLKTFLKRYSVKDKPLYSVTPIHETALGGAFRLPPFVACGGWLDRLQSVVFWLGEYETKSVLHNDDVDGVMCLLTGRKRWYFVDKRHWRRVESKACGWNVADETGRGYGAFARLNVDDVRPALRECYNATEWYHADMEAGDCLLTPSGWYHQVSSEGRALGVLMWLYALRDFNATSAGACEGGERERAPLNELGWHGDDDVDFVAGDEAWAEGWLKAHAPGHPWLELYEERRRGAPADDGGE